MFFGYKSLNKSNNTFFKDICLLENSTNISVDINLNIKKTRYWKPKLNINKFMNSKEAAEGINHYLIKSLNLRMRSDVPIAFCLSGGIDSFLAFMQKNTKKDISTFSIIDNDSRYDESENINIIIKDLKCKSEQIK